MIIRYVFIFDLIDCGIVMQRIICLNCVCGIEYWNFFDMLVGKCGILDII